MTARTPKPRASQRATGTTRAPEPTDRDLLVALRDQLIAAIADARTAEPDKQGPIAPLAKQLRDTLAAIAALPQAQRSARDEIADRRAARLAGAAVPARAKRKDVGGSGRGGARSKRGSDPGPVAGTGT